MNQFDTNINPVPEETKLWRPEIGEPYYWIDFEYSEGLEVIYTGPYNESDKLTVDTFFVFPDNFFPTAEAAEAAKKELEASWITISNKYQKI